MRWGKGWLPLLAAGLACGHGAADPSAVAGIGPCREFPRLDPPHAASAVIVVNDAMRRDRAGAYDGPALTPNFDAFARANLLFTRAESSAPWTKPAVGSLFSSLQPSQHGALGHVELRELGESEPVSEVLNDGIDTLAEVAHRAGLRTAAFVANPWLVEGFGFEQGFEIYDASFARWDAPGERVTQAALDWLRTLAPGQRFLLYVHYVDSHLPYGPLRKADLDAARARIEADHRPVPEEVQFYLARWRLEDGGLLLYEDVPPALTLFELAYDRGIENFDHALGGLLQGLEQRPDYARTAVVVTSDHGEALFEHGWGNHGRSLYEEEIAIPLAARLPGAAPERSRVTCPVSLVDLMPTLCDYLGITCPSGLAGVSLLAAPAEPDDGDPHYLVSEGVAGWPEHRAIQNTRYKLIFEPGGPMQPNLRRDEALGRRKPYALYDKQADPREQNDLLAGWWTPRGVAAIADVMGEALQRAAPAVPLPPPREVPLDPAVQQRLRELGYLEGDAP